MVALITTKEKKLKIKKNGVLPLSVTLHSRLSFDVKMAMYPLQLQQKRYSLRNCLGNSCPFHYGMFPGHK